MPLAKFVLLFVIVIAAAGITVAVGTMIASLLNVPPGLALAALMPLAAIAYVGCRVVADRLTNAEDDKYDQIPR